MQLRECRSAAVILQAFFWRSVVFEVGSESYQSRSHTTRKSAGQAYRVDASLLSQTEVPDT
jgi:hypothetical protein